MGGGGAVERSGSDEEDGRSEMCVAMKWRAEYRASQMKSNADEINDGPAHIIAGRHARVRVRANGTAVGSLRSSGTVGDRGAEVTPSQTAAARSGRGEIP